LYDILLILEAMKQLQEAGFNRVVPNVSRRGITFRQSAFAPVESALHKAGVRIYPICTLVEEGYRFGMHVTPLFEYGFMEPATSQMVQQNPDWVLSRADG